METTTQTTEATMTTPQSVTVYIDSDRSTLGEAATQADLNQYADNLESHLEEKFPGVSVTVEQRLGGGPLGNRCPDNDEIAEYVRDLETGDGWTDLLGAADETAAPGRLIDYATSDVIRDATPAELAASRAAAARDGGRGVIEVDGRRCYVEE